MRSWHVADTIVVLALSVGAALARRIIGAGPVLDDKISNANKMYECDI